MHAYQAVGLVALAGLASAMPAQGTVAAQWTAQQVPINGTAKIGQLEYYRALSRYQKLGAQIPTHVKVAAEKAVAAAAASTGTVVASPEQYDQEYLCPVQIGTPAQTLNMDFDTGSADFWVFSSQQPSSQRSGHSIYTPGSSSTSSKDSGESWDISYGDGSGAEGDVYFDKVTIGGITATKQAVECAESVSSEFVQDKQNDGLVGFAFDSINTGYPTTLETWIDNVKSQLAQPLFAAYLKYKAAGAYDFGFLNPAHYTGSVTYTTVNTANGFWQFTAGNYLVGGSSKGSLGSVIADTGTSIILVSATAVKNYYAQVSGAQNSNTYGGYVFPCSASLPSFGVTISGVTYTVPGTYINYAPVEAGSSTCYGGIQSDAGIGFAILGDVFLKSVYAVFNLSGPKIGFAHQP